MKIQTLKDLKEALNEIPNKVLNDFGFGVDSETEKVRLLCYAEDAEEEFIKNVNEYPSLQDINNFVNKIFKVQNEIDNDAEKLDEYSEMDEALYYSDEED
jgi:hypothetical protein